VKEVTRAEGSLNRLHLSLDRTIGNRLGQNSFQVGGCLSPRPREWRETPLPITSTALRRAKSLMISSCHSIIRRYASRTLSRRSGRFLVTL
jgi:hypothetical protein